MSYNTCTVTKDPEKPHCQAFTRDSTGLTVYRLPLGGTSGTSHCIFLPLYCCTFSTSKFRLPSRFNAILRDLTQLNVATYKIETTVPVGLCETESSEVGFSTIYARSICPADAMLVSVTAEGC